MLGLLAVFLLQAVAAVSFVVREQVTFTSDQAVPALMALEIRDHGAHPVFYWGVQYDGSLEPHLLSLAFRVLPETVWTYRLVMFGLLAAGTLLVALASAWAFGQPAGLLTGAYLATGPSFLYFKLLSSDGVYASFFALTAAFVFLATVLHHESTDVKARGLCFALGLVLGVAWWVTPLSVVLLAVVAAGVVTSPGAWMKLDRIGLLFIGAVGGASPWLGENLRTGFASLRLTEMTAADPGLISTQLRILVQRGLPVLLGGRSPGGRLPTFPGSEVISVAVLIGLLFTGAALALRKGPRSGRFLALASAALLVAPAILALSRERTDFREDPRFLLASYVGLAALAGVALAKLLERGTRFIALAFAALLVLLGPLSQVQSHRYRDDPRLGRIPETRALAAQLASLGVREVYAEYWVAYRLAFLSRGRVTASPFGEGAQGPIRDLRAYEVVEKSESPAFFLDLDAARRLRGFLEGRSARFRHETVLWLGSELIWEIPRSELAALRACRCLAPTAQGALSGSAP